MYDQSMYVSLEKKRQKMCTCKVLKVVLVVSHRDIRSSGWSPNLSRVLIHDFVRNSTLDDDRNASKFRITATWFIGNTDTILMAISIPCSIQFPRFVQNSVPHISQPLYRLKFLSSNGAKMSQERMTSFIARSAPFPGVRLGQIPYSGSSQSNIQSSLLCFVIRWYPNMHIAQLQFEVERSPTSTRSNGRKIVVNSWTFRGLEERLKRGFIANKFTSLQVSFLLQSSPLALEAGDN